MKVGFALALAALLATVASASAQQIKIGFVDLQRALNDSTAGKKAKEEFKKQVERLQVDLKAQKERLEALKEQLEKKALVMKEEERRNLEKDYQKKLRDFELAYKDSQSELQMKDNELTADLLKELQVVIEQYGKNGNYTIILEQASSSVLYGAPEIDLTDQIIEAYNRTK
jgi:outer membrane protein